MTALKSVSVISLSLLLTASVLAQEKDLEIAEKLFKAKKWEQAREHYLAALSSASGNTAARISRQIGYTWQIQHKHDKALPYFHRVINSPDLDTEHYSGALLRLGYSLRLLGKGEEGIAALDRAAALKDAPSAHRAEALLYAAWEHNSRKELTQALNKLSKVGEVEQVHANYVASAYLSMGRIYQQQKNYEQAISTYRKIASLKPVAPVNRARTRVYLLECQALLEGDTPFHIKPYVIKVTTNQAQLCWVSQGNIPAGEVTITSSAQKAAIQSTSAGKSSLQDTVCNLHTADLRQLQPNTRYQYTVKCAGKTSEGVFKTAPMAGTPITFSVIGDTQSYHEGLQKLLDAMAEVESDFVLHVGDITDRGNLWGEWKGCFFDPGWGYLKKQTLWPVYGNHDGGPYFPALFNLQKKYWYSFDWGDAHFIVLDSYGAGSGGNGRKEQLAWLAKDLENNKKLWTIVALHVPMVATRKSLKWFGSEDFLPLLEQHEVDVVFSGHHPHYRRYYPIGRTNKKKILHITSGGGGGPVGGYLPSPVLAKGINLNHFCQVTIDGPKLKLSAHAINGATIDRFELTKQQQSQIAQQAVPTEQAKSIIGLYQELLSDRTFEFTLWCDKPKSDSRVEALRLDLSKLPRGPLDPKQYQNSESLIIESTKDSVWKIPRQAFPMKAGVGHFQTTPPESIKIHNGHLTPDARVRIQLTTKERKFEPVECRCRIRILPVNE